MLLGVASTPHVKLLGVAFTPMSRYWVLPQLPHRDEQVGKSALPGWTPVPALVPDQAALQRLLDERMDRLTVQMVRPSASRFGGLACCVLGACNRQSLTKMVTCN